MNWKRKMTTLDGENVAKEYRRKLTGATHVLKNKNRSKGAQKYSNMCQREKKKKQK